jgi:hypothetical protein
LQKNTQQFEVLSQVKFALFGQSPTVWQAVPPLS